ITHVTGIPHSPTGQAMVERMNQTLKHLLQKQKWGEKDISPADRLNKVLYVLNYLSLPQDSLVPPMVKHGAGLKGGLEGIKESQCELFDKKLKLQVLTWG
ncbi:POK6 protein, partial [Atlantisia rogersi]|nr:POK6 protein [Atlantisia rogersi]NXV80693.1 POK6 protein [Atlantisia rogersi]